MKPLILFAHGAGAGSSSAFMREWSLRLSSLGQVVTFDYPYMASGKKLPDRLPILIEAHRAALEKARKRSRRPVILAGKSMGSRVSCHLSLEEKVDAVLCFGYPLVSSGKKRAVRSDVLLAMTTPILFVQGDDDPMCPLGQLKSLRKQMQAKSELIVVKGGDHSLALSATAKKTLKTTQEQSDESVLLGVTAALAAWLPR